MWHLQVKKNIAVGRTRKGTDLPRLISAGMRLSTARTSRAGTEPLKNKKPI
jgi:hypothetical protein